MRGFTILLILSLHFLIACGSTESGCPDATCDQYTTQTEAQAAFDRDRDCLGKLDSDKDGIACEHLPAGGGSMGSGGGSSGCPTTASCGCSGKNKNACGGPCCKWTVGSGCGCS